jgi:glycosyltransferase involved in cell wall biosynthesis
MALSYEAMEGRHSPVAFAQDWLTIEGGAERVALEMTRLLPAADIHTTFFDPQLFGGAIAAERVRTWPIQRLVGPTRRIRPFLPLYPPYFSRLDLRGYDLVVSGSIAFTHAVRTAPEALHISYVYTPMRYAWDLDTYLEDSSLPLVARIAARMLRQPLQRWDRATASRPDVLVAISGAVRDRIKRLWGRDAEVIYPPVEVAGIPLLERDDGYLLVAARMLAYRRLDLAIEAAVRLDRELIVVGDGPERRNLEARGAGRVRFLGWVDRTTLLDLFGRCHAYVVPGVEDFGIAPVEAMAAGKPVVAFRGGGVAETVVDGETGVFFDHQDWRSLADSIERLDSLTWSPAAIRQRAEAFDTEVFHSRWRSLFERLGVDPSLYRLA